MNNRQKDWIIFLGVSPDRYDEVVAIVREWREYARAHGVDRQGLTRLNGRLFGGRRLTGHSCCLSYRSLRVNEYRTIVADFINEYRTIVADFIDGSRLQCLPELFEKAGHSMPEGDWEYMLVNQPVTFLLYTEYFYVLGFTLDGRIVIDTKEMYGDVAGQAEYARANGDREYYRRLLDTVKKNYARVLLPEVPKGILKLPDRL